MKQRVWIAKDWSGGHRLVIIEDVPRDSSRFPKIKVCTDFSWTEYDEGSLFDQQSGLPAADSLIQAVVDRAWEAGFRPRGFGDVKNETEAIRAHLTDMRTVAFHKLGIKS